MWKILTITLLFLLFANIIKSQPVYLTSYEWGSAQDDTITSVVYHVKADLIYAAGYTYGFIGRVGSSAGNADMFVSLLPLTAGPLTFQYGTEFEDRATAVAYDAGRAYVHVAGWTQGLLAGDRIYGLEDATLTTLSLTSIGGATLDHYQWGTPGNDRPACAQVDPFSASVYVAGVTTGAFPGYTNAGGDDVFMSIKNSQNAFTNIQWGTKGYDSVGGCAFDTTSGVFYVAGSTSGAMPGYNSSGGYDAFVTVFSRSNTIRHFQWGTPYSEIVTGAVYNTRLKALMVIGYTNGAFGDTASKGAQDGFLSVITFNSDGTFNVTNNQYGTIGNDIPTGISTDVIYNAIYVSGYTSGSFPGFTSKGATDPFLATFMATHPEYPPTLLQWGSNKTDQCTAVAASSSNPNVYCVGWTDGVFEDAAQGSILGGRELFATGVRKELLTLPTAPTTPPTDDPPGSVGDDDDSEGGVIKPAAALIVGLVIILLTM